jgi:hypothetical protein
VERGFEEEQSDTDSLASVVRRVAPTPPFGNSRFPFFGKDVLIPKPVVDTIKAMADDVAVSIEIKRYMLDLIVFLRMHRAVCGGISTRATKDFEELVRYFADFLCLEVFGV